MTKSRNLHGVGTALTNWALATVFALFAYAHVQAFLETPRLSVLLIVAMEALLAFFILFRIDPSRTWHSWQTWLTTCGGTFFPLLLRPAEMQSDLLLGQVVQLTGVSLQILALLSLNRSMGLLPAHREVKSNGLYRLVRHPLYAAYSISLLGYLINNPSLYNTGVLVIGTAFQVMRIRNEEALLLEYDDYTAFTQRTRWRLVPFIW